MMTKEYIDDLWHKAMEKALKPVDQHVRYHFAELVAEECAKECDFRKGFAGSREDQESERCAKAIRERFGA